MYNIESCDILYYTLYGRVLFYIIHYKSVYGRVILYIIHSTVS